MPYDIITKEEAEKKEFTPWEPGEYDFTILESVSFGTKTYTTEETSSKAGNPMLIAAIKVFAKDGSDYTSHIVDYILMTNESGMAFKHRHLADAVGLTAKYESGKLTVEDLIGKSGKCKLAIQKGSKKDDGSYYNDKNIIADYIPKEESLAGMAKPKKKDEKIELNDDIPF